MELTVLRFVLGMLLLAVPVYIIYALELHRMRKLLLAVGYMLGMVALTGLGTYILMRWNNVWVNMLSGVVMVGVSTVCTIRQAKLRVSRLLVPVASGVFAAVFVVGLYVVFLVLGAKNPFDTRLFIPVFGLLTGGIISLNAHALHTYYMGLKHHNQLYYYLLGNGSTHREAVHYFVRRSFQAALTPMMKQMSGLVVSSSPLVMLVLIWGGVDAITAMGLQIVFFVMIMSASFISLFITILVGRRYSFDEYERLRPVSNRSAAERPGAIPSSASESSANLSAPRHTDVESQPQES